MKGTLIKQGEFPENNFPALLLLCYREKINGILTVKNPFFEKTIFIENGTVYFATSSNPDDSLGSILLKEKIINQEQFTISTRYMNEKGIRHGRAMLELNFINHEQLWEYVEKQLKQIVFSLFAITSGTYKINALRERIEENITLNHEIPYLILEGCRKLQDHDFLNHFFADKKKLYFQKKDPEIEKKLKPYEYHILELLKKYNDLETIINKSELLPLETKKILFFLIVSELISTNYLTHCENPNEFSCSRNRGRFNSFSDAIKYYNLIYRHIFKTFHKELGLVSLNLLNQSIKSVADKLPIYLHNQELKSDGTLEEETILKNLWYSDNDDSWQIFLNGLEEILFAEIYAIRKHLGKDFEQEILKWIREREKS